MFEPSLALNLLKSFDLPLHTLHTLHTCVRNLAFKTWIVKPHFKRINRNNPTWRPTTENDQNLVDYIISFERF